jgi:hypothetical protein
VPSPHILTTDSIQRQNSNNVFHTSQSPQILNNSTIDQVICNRRKLSDSKKKQRQCNDFIPIRQLPESEREEIVQKWHSLILYNDTNNTNSTIEDRRFQLLVAVRLHARCQEITVRKAMIVLYERIQPIFSVQNVAQLDPTILATWITNLQFYNVKAKQIVQSSNEIITTYNGYVPEKEIDLIHLTGIGPMFADLLSYVNSREIHEQIRISKREKKAG